MAAITLAKRGYQVLLIEKQALPRYKACGGAVSAKTQELLDFPLAEICEEEIFQAQIGVLGGSVAEVGLDEPFLYLVQRTRFDQRLVKDAIAQGVNFKDQAEFKSLVADGNSLVVTTSENTYRTRFVIGADGAMSAVRGQLGIKWKPQLGIALEGEYPVGEGRSGWPPGTLAIDLGYPGHGYSWVFPKGDSLSIGLGTFSRTLPGAKDMLDSYLKAKGFAGLKPEILRGHPIPADGARKKILHSRWGVAIGDAAGLVDPLTGEGIYYAILSGKIAGEEIAEALQTGSRNLQHYSERIYLEIAKDLRSGARLALLVFKYPETLVKLLVGKPARGKLLLNVIYGQENYKSLILQVLRMIGHKVWRKLVSWIPNGRRS